MSSRGHSLLYGLIALLLLAGAFCLAWDHRALGVDASERTFQTSVGGLGLGSTAVPYWDYSAFDPRLQSVCTCLSWPIPGIYPYSPDHTASLFHFEERPGDKPQFMFWSDDAP